MEFKAYIKNVRISPKKLRFFLPVIKKLTPSEAMNYLFYMPQKAAKILYKSIKSAVDNAKSVAKIEENLLKFKFLTIEQGFVFKRYRPGGRGTVKPYKKRTAHIKIILEAQKPSTKITEKEVLSKNINVDENRGMKGKSKKEITKLPNRNIKSKKI